jgi:hypothetical protein
LAGCAGKSAAPEGFSVQVTPPPASAEDLPCLAGEGVNSRYTGNVSGLGISDDQIVITSDQVLRVPLEGGDPIPLATPESPYGLLLLGGRAYFEATHPDGAAVGGKQPSSQTLDSVSLAGGDSSTALGDDLAPGPLDSASADTDSLYFPARSSSSAITRFTPPSAHDDLALSGPGLLVDAIGAYGSYVYVAAQDLSNEGFSNGLIVRVPKNGGDMQRLITNIGHPWNLVAAASGIYWIEDPQGFSGGTQLRHAGLDGSQITNLLAMNSDAPSPSSLAIGGAQIYFAAGDTVASIPIAGGAVTTITSGQNTPGMLTAAGQNVAWLAPASKALSDPTVPQVFTACAAQH